MRRPAARVKPRISELKSFPAPVHGWIANVNLATPNARWRDGTSLQGAYVLENHFPTATGIRMRGGSQRYAVIGTDELPVTALFSYRNGPTGKLFAANENAIYNVTSVAFSDNRFVVDGDGNYLVDSGGNFIVLSASPTADVDTLGGGDWVFVQFATSGGVFLVGVNGVDAPLNYDGSAWATTPAITGVTPEDLSYVWAYKNRLFFVEKDTLNAWFLPVDSIGGAASKFPLGGVFTLGGSLLFGAEWSLDTGGGLSTQCAFFSSEGEVAIYQGSVPGGGGDFVKVGVYRIGRPKGKEAFIRAGGDLVIATDIGFIPLSQAINRDVAALGPAAVSYPIQDAWKTAIAERTDNNWQCAVWPTKETVAVAFPPEASQQDTMFVANANTGAWTKYTGWGATCVHVFGERFFFGTEDGRVVEGEVTGADQSAPYTSKLVPLFDPLKSPASLKTGLQSRVVYRGERAVTAQLSLQHDYMVNLPSAPDDTRLPGSSEWGTAIWGESVWGSSADKITFSPWRSTPGSGYALSPASQITSGNLSPPDIEIVQTDLMYEKGDIGT